MAFEALEECIYSGNFDVCEAVPSGEPSGFLINPIAGVAIDMAGPARLVFRRERKHVVREMNTNHYKPSLILPGGSKVTSIAQEQQPFD